MLVENWMHTDPVTVEPRATVQDAFNRLQEQGASQAPVMQKGSLVGMFTDRDAQEALLRFLGRARKKSASTVRPRPPKVQDVMRREFLTLTPQHTVEEAALLFLENSVSWAPVVEESGAVAGIFTQEDMLRAVVAMTGAAHRSVQFGLLVDDTPHAIQEATEILHKNGGRVLSIMSTREGAPFGSWLVYIRIQSLDKDLLETCKCALENKTDLLYVLDQRESARAFSWGGKDYTIFKEEEF